MTTDVENNEWKAEAPYLASLPRTTPFRVPEQYFETLPSAITDSVYTEQLKEEVKSAGYTVPENYFETLQESISLQTTGGALANIPKTQGYSTPDNYFEKLQASILAKTVAETSAIEQGAIAAGQTSAEPTLAPVVKKETRIVRLWHSDLLKYASAACFILVTAFGLYLNQQNYTTESATADIANEQMLYDIDEQDIIDHVQGNVIEDKVLVPSEAELETYILNNYSQNELSTDL